MPADTVTDIACLLLSSPRSTPLLHTRHNVVFGSQLPDYILPHTSLLLRHGLGFFFFFATPLSSFYADDYGWWGMGYHRHVTYTRLIIYSIIIV